MLVKYCNRLLVTVCMSVLLCLTFSIDAQASKEYNQNTSDNIEQYREYVTERAEIEGIAEYVPWLMAKIQVEYPSSTWNDDIMQSSESLGFAVNTLKGKDSIDQGVKYMAGLIKNNIDSVDFMTILQSYNFGGGFVSHVKNNHGGVCSFDASMEFALKMNEKMGWTPQWVSYNNSITNGLGYENKRVQYGNMYYFLLVSTYVTDEYYEKTVGGLKSGAITAEGIDADDLGIPSEHDLNGMRSQVDLTSNFDTPTLAGKENLTNKENLNLSTLVTVSALHDSEGFFGTVRALLSFVGILLMLYGFALIMAYVFDKTNSIVDLNLFTVLTLGFLRVWACEFDDADKKSVKVGKLLLLVSVVEAVGILLATGTLVSCIHYIYVLVMSKF